MRCSTVRPSELGAPELERWRGLLDGTGLLGNPFLAPEFAIAVGAVRPEARVTVFEDGGGIVGFFAHERHGAVARPIGHTLSDCEALVHAPGHAPAVAELLRRSGLAGWDFECLVEGQLPRGAYRTQRQSSPVIELGEGYEAYVEALRGRSKKWFASTFRKQRKLEREVGELRFEFESDDAEALAALKRWKSGQYASLGEWDRFADRKIVRLVDDLVQSRAAGCSGALSVLYAGDRPIAAHAGLWSGSVLSWWLPAYDNDFGKYSPGILLLFQLAEAAAKRGVGTIDLGRGRHDYKDAMQTGELVVCSGSVDAPSIGSLPRRAKRVAKAGLRPLVGADAPLGRKLRALAGRG
ncbi:GNAT family N-acetyltransferase [Actinomycetes bacterium KLBMP 9759]